MFGLLTTCGTNTSVLYSAQTVRFGTGIPPWKIIFTVEQKLYRVIEKTPTTLSMLCRTASWSLLKEEPMSGKARYGRSRPSKCPFHMSSIKRTNSMQHKAGYKRGSNGVHPTSMQSLQRRRWAARTWSNKCGCLEIISIATCTLAMRSSSDVTVVAYTKDFILPHRK